MLAGFCLGSNLWAEMYGWIKAMYVLKEELKGAADKWWARALFQKNLVRCGLPDQPVRGVHKWSARMAATYWLCLKVHVSPPPPPPPPLPPSPQLSHVCLPEPGSTEAPSVAEYSNDAGLQHEEDVHVLQQGCRYGFSGSYYARICTHTCSLTVPLPYTWRLTQPGRASHSLLDSLDTKEANLYVIELPPSAPAAEAGVDEPNLDPAVLHMGESGGAKEEAIEAKLKSATKKHEIDSRVKKLSVEEERAKSTAEEKAEKAAKEQQTLAGVLRLSLLPL